MARWEICEVTWLTPDIFPEKSYGVRLTYRSPNGTQRESRTARDWLVARNDMDMAIQELLADGWEPISEFIFRRKYRKR